jgi:hypothetical protein
MSDILRHDQEEPVVMNPEEYAAEVMESVRRDFFLAPCSELLGAVPTDLLQAVVDHRRQNRA